MYQLYRTATFAKWLRQLRDRKAKARIISRLDSFKLGNFGDCKSLGGGIREMRVHTGPGYRVYFVQRGELILVLLCGGSKSSQSRDIERARRLLDEIEELK
jgi:putative addiction module killer protein